MKLSTWIRSLHVAPRRGKSEKRRHRCRPIVESLECRTVPSTFWVSNRHDSGAGSLRQAVLDANSHTGADEIKFRHEAEGTITLTSGQISITGDLRIDGPDADDLTISGGGTSRVFNVASGINLRIDDLTIADGFVPGASGGGILNAGNLTLNQSVVSGNTAFPGGGGIANSGNLILNHSTITNNYSSYGGGLLNTGGTALLTHVTISNNLGYQAGGIRSENGSTLTIQNSLITGNSAGDSPGTAGITSYYSDLNIVNTTISENTGGNRAGLYFFGSGDCVISGSRIVHNSAPSGLVGAIHVQFQGAGLGHMRIEGTTISGNTGLSAGAFVDYSGFQVTEVVNSTISGNVSTSSGFGAGGFLTFAPLTVTDSTFRENAGGEAGAILSLAALEITRSTVSGNSATPVSNPAYYQGGNTGAGGIEAFGGATINNSTISNNMVIADGMGPATTSQPWSGAAGGILAVFSGVTIDHSTIAFNRVTNAPIVVSQVSGAVTGVNFSSPYGSSEANVNVRNSIIASNMAAGRDPDVTGSFQSQGHNLIGVLTATATGFVASDLRGTMAMPLDPRLGPLKNNGGPTKTHALRHNSPALNAGDNADAPPTDQRGHARIVDGIIDIGAYEASFHGDDDGPMAGFSADVSDKSDKPVISALVGQRQERSPGAGIAFQSDELFASRREVQRWLGIDGAGKHSLSERLPDSSFAMSPFDLPNAIFVGTAP